MWSSFKYLIRKRAMGDVLWIEPIIAELAKQTDKLIVHTRYNELFQNYPLSNVVFKNRLSLAEKILVRISRLPFLNKFVVNLDNAYEVAPAQHFLHAYQHKAGLQITDVYPSIYLSTIERSQFFHLKDQCPYVVIHSENSALGKIRKVQGVDWQLVVSHILDQGYKVYQLGGSETAISGAVLMKTSIRDMVALLYHASFFIGIDSGPSHLAAALKIPSIIVFTAVNPDFRHFRSIFNGNIIKHACCLDVSTSPFSTLGSTTCNLVGANEVPPCCMYTARQVTDGVDQLLSDINNL